MCAQGKAFFCRECWIRESPESEQGEWDSWFARRANAYKRAFPPIPSDWKLQVCDDTL